MTGIWPFVPSNAPTSLAHAKGSYLYLQNGKKILDAAGGAVVANVGHGRREVADAIHAATLNATYVVPPWLTPEREALVHELREHWLPEHLPCVHLCSGGSEGNESAIKIAVQYQTAIGQPQRRLILARQLSYHGTTISMAGLSGHASRKRGLESILEQPPYIQTPYPLRCPLGPHHPDACDYYLQDLEDTIERLGPENIAALIAEPINGSSGGAITPPQGYWQRAQRILNRHGILLIMDEVMTGFGRTGVAFGSQLYGVEPDLLVAGKGLAGGYAAVAGVFGRADIAQAIATAGFNVMFHTFGALPQSCAAATAVLKILREEDLVARSASLGQTTVARLRSAFGQHPNVAEIRGAGMLIGIEIVKDRDTLERFDASARITEQLSQAAMDAGVFFYPGGTGEYRDVLCIGAPFIIGEPEIDLMERALGAALASLP
ncbi:MAG: aspartate aminotransferase family protein [Gammaproteobacteria bacterium TMED92]|nr:MAG: aspartate aminotransferase family protein [Gammaproteobacteria bacterium TMED92]